jgi:hypothetical protein
LIQTMSGTRPLIISTRPPSSTTDGALCGYRTRAAAQQGTARQEIQYLGGCVCARTAGEVNSATRRVMERSGGTMPLSTDREGNRSHAECQRLEIHGRQGCFFDRSSA